MCVALDVQFIWHPNPEPYAVRASPTTHLVAVIVRRKAQRRALALALCVARRALRIACLLARRHPGGLLCLRLRLGLRLGPVTSGQKVRTRDQPHRRRAVRRVDRRTFRRAERLQR